MRPTHAALARFGDQRIEITAGLEGIDLVIAIARERQRPFCRNGLLHERNAGGRGIAFKQFIDQAACQCLFA